MSVSSLRLRRSLTVAGALAALVLGFAAIQAAAAWTASAAPLSVTPTSATSIESKLADEQTRSADLQAQLGDLSGNAEQLATALAAAQARIDADAKHAAELEKDLQTAKKKLAALQQSIRAAAAVVAAPAVATSAAAAPRPARGGGGEVDDGG
jgi:septal ring factor EnvC (AmiA/AmiB activator)